MNKMVTVAILACVLGVFDVALADCDWYKFGFGSDCEEQKKQEARERQAQQAEIDEEKCNKQGVVESCVQVGDYYRIAQVSNDKAKKYYDKAIEILANKCQSGWIFKDTLDAEACYKLGEIYQNGLGNRIPIDTKQAKKYFEIACEAGHTRACEIK